MKKKFDIKNIGSLAFGFTMAEAILVMTILGIIATIMIANIKPSEFREQAMQIQAKKVMNEIDEAINLIITNDSESGNMFIIRDSNDSSVMCVIDGSDAHACLIKAFEKYLSVSRKACDDYSCPCHSHDNYTSFYLKDGSCMALMLKTNVDTIIPGEETPTKISKISNCVFFDVNGESGPNILGKDQYTIPFYSKGLWFDTEAITGKPNGAQCGMDFDCASRYCKSKYQNKSNWDANEPWGICASS